MTYVLDIPHIDGEDQENTLGRIALRARAQWRQARLSAIFFSMCSFVYIVELVIADSATPNALLFFVVAMLTLMVVFTVQSANEAIINRRLIDWSMDWIRRILITKAVTEQAESVARLFNQEQRGNLLSHPDPEQLG